MRYVTEAEAREHITEGTLVMLGDFGVKPCRNGGVPVGVVTATSNAAPGHVHVMLGGFGMAGTAGNTYDGSGYQAPLKAKARCCDNCGSRRWVDDACYYCGEER